MEAGDWLSQNWFNLLSSVGIIAGLWFTAFTLRSDAKTRRVANLLTIVTNHREIWKVFLNDKSLERIRDASADTVKTPVTDAERIFVNMVIQHLGSMYYAMSDQLVVKVEGMRRDIAQFLSLPVPRNVWEKIKVYQNDDFAAFVESCRNWK